MAHTLIFDIGKSNKKAFVFDENYRPVYKELIAIEELVDEDGFPCDNLSAIEQWMMSVLNMLIKSEEYNIQAINFTTYGASLVHLDVNGKVLTPFYNYLKPIPEDVLHHFYDIYGDEMDIARQTASPPLGMLNSGLQLYWLKQTQPEVYDKVQYSLHFPQYLSYLLTNKAQSEYTSIGCHTALWDFSKNDYHNWVYHEGLHQKLAPVVPSSTTHTVVMGEKTLKVGVGIHDSSSSLLPYIMADSEPFSLISTGTWSISLNPFSDDYLLKDDDLKKDCLNYMRVDGKAVKAARLFLGEEFNNQVSSMETYFAKTKGAYKKVYFDSKLYVQAKARGNGFFRYNYLITSWEQPEEMIYDEFDSFESAYHHLMFEMVELQMASLELAIGATDIHKLYIDGGFVDNEVYISGIAERVRNIELRTTQSPMGSALGAALVMNEIRVDDKFLKRNFALKKI